MSKGRWEAKNHGLRDAVAMRPPLVSEEEIAKPSREKKRKRVLPTNTPKLKKSTTRKPKANTVALSSETAQRLRDEDEEKNDDCLLVVRKKGSTDALKSAEPMVVDAVHSRTEEISERSSSKVPESSGNKIAPRLEGYLEGSTKGRAGGATPKGAQDEGGRDPRVEFQSVKEERLTRSRKIEELEAKFAVELAKAKSEAEAFISSYRDDAEAANTRSKEISTAAEVNLSCSLYHARRQSRRETLEEVHARGFDLSADIEKAKTLEEEVATAFRGRRFKQWLREWRIRR
ncbi:uncharacterized protein [Nicotiana sylvestris]|uniref:uncharacterized protein n=1 Tax=Nicotiana sylvestris TaxID=4096 RepID=UPI00388C9D65